jgi:hypothetical protein
MSTLYCFCVIYSLIFHILCCYFISLTEEASFTACKSSVGSLFAYDAGDPGLIASSFNRHVNNSFGGYNFSFIFNL